MFKIMAVLIERQPTGLLIRAGLARCLKNIQDELMAERRMMAPVMAKTVFAQYIQPKKDPLEKYVPLSQSEPLRATIEIFRTWGAEAQILAINTTFRALLAFLNPLELGVCTTHLGMLTDHLHTLSEENEAALLRHEIWEFLKTLICLPDPDFEIALSKFPTNEYICIEGTRERLQEAIHTAEQAQLADVIQKEIIQHHLLSKIGIHNHIHLSSGIRAVIPGILGDKTDSFSLPILAELEIETLHQVRHAVIRAMTHLVARAWVEPFKQICESAKTDQGLNDTLYQENLSLFRIWKMVTGMNLQTMLFQEDEDNGGYMQKLQPDAEEVLNTVMESAFPPTHPLPVDFEGLVSNQSLQTLGVRLADGIASGTGSGSSLSDLWIVFTLINSMSLDEHPLESVMCRAVRPIVYLMDRIQSRLNEIKNQNWNILKELRKLAVKAEADRLGRTLYSRLEKNLETWKMETAAADAGSVAQKLIAGYIWSDIRPLLPERTREKTKLAAALIAQVRRLPYCDVNAIKWAVDHGQPTDDFMVEVLKSAMSSPAKFEEVFIVFEHHPAMRKILEEILFNDSHRKSPFIYSVKSMIVALAHRAQTPYIQTWLIRKITAIATRETKPHLQEIIREMVIKIGIYATNDKERIWMLAMLTKLVQENSRVKALFCHRDIYNIIVEFGKEAQSDTVREGVMGLIDLFMIGLPHEQRIFETDVIRDMMIKFGNKAATDKSKLLILGIMKKWKMDKKDPPSFATLPARDLILSFAKASLDPHVKLESIRMMMKMMATVADWENLVLTAEVRDMIVEAGLNSASEEIRAEVVSAISAILNTVKSDRFIFSDTSVGHMIASIYHTTASSDIRMVIHTLITQNLRLWPFEILSDIAAKVDTEKDMDLNLSYLDAIITLPAGQILCSNTDFKAVILQLGQRLESAAHKKRMIVILSKITTGIPTPSRSDFYDRRMQAMVIGLFNAGPPESATQRAYLNVINALLNAQDAIVPYPESAYSQDMPPDPHSLIQTHAKVLRDLLLQIGNFFSGSDSAVQLMEARLILAKYGEPPSADLKTPDTLEILIKWADGLAHSTGTKKQDSPADETELSQADKNTLIVLRFIHLFLPETHKIPSSGLPSIINALLTMGTALATESVRHQLILTLSKFPTGFSGRAIPHMLVTIWKNINTPEVRTALSTLIATHIQREAATFLADLTAKATENTHYLEVITIMQRLLSHPTGKPLLSTATTATVMATLLSQPGLSAESLPLFFTLLENNEAAQKLYLSSEIQKCLSKLAFTPEVFRILTLLTSTASGNKACWNSLTMQGKMRIISDPSFMASESSELPIARYMAHMSRDTEGKKLFTTPGYISTLHRIIATTTHPTVRSLILQTMWALHNESILPPEQKAEIIPILEAAGHLLTPADREIILKILQYLLERNPAAKSNMITTTLPELLIQEVDKLTAQKPSDIALLLRTIRKLYHHNPDTVSARRFCAAILPKLEAKVATLTTETIPEAVRKETVWTLKTLRCHPNASVFRRKIMG